jgi:hypothetical protein
MFDLVLPILFVAWKIALISLVGVFVYDMYTHVFLKYTKLIGLTLFALFSICFGLALCLWVTNHLPINPEFWTSWYFPDDVAAVLLTYGVTTLIRVGQYTLSKE